MASGSQNMTTYNARTVTGSNSAASPAGALLLSGAGRADDATGDTWIFLDSLGGTSTPWGIKHDQVHDKIHIYGNGTNSVWTRMNTGDTYILGKVGIGYDPETSENSYKLYVNGSSYFTDHMYIGRNDSAHIYLINKNWTKGTNPSSQTYSAIEYNDVNNSRVALLEATLDTSGNSQFNIFLVPNVTSSTSWSGIILQKTNANVLTVNIAGTTTVSGTVHANGGYLKSTLNNNTLTIGSQNTSWCHFENSANIPFWFSNTIQMAQGKIIGGPSTQYRPFQLYLGRYTTSGSNALNAGNPLIEFSNADRSQYCQLIYDDWDSLCAPDSLTLVGNQNGINFICKNGPIWIQGGSNAGGNVNRLNTTSGTPGNMQYNTSRRGTQIYSNGIAFADPYNGNSNSDAGWIRHIETSANNGILEIAVGDDGAEEIIVRQYNTSNNVARQMYLLNSAGFTSVSNQSTDSSYAHAAMQIREENYGGAGADNWGRAPRLAWHWSGRVAAQIGLASNGWLYEAPQTGTNFYRIVCETGTWGINITGSAGSVAWNNVTGKPSTFPPSSHTHSYLPLSGGTMTGNISFSNSGTGFRGINYGEMGDNDQWRIGGAATGSNAGYMEIATADDGTEPIYVRQYTGVFSSLKRTLTLLDASGNTTFPGSLYLNNRGTNIIYNGPNDNAYGVGGALNNLVISSWWGVSFTTSCGGQTYTNTNAVTINCRNGHLYAAGVHNAVWNDLGESRKSIIREPGYVIAPSGARTSTRLEPGARIISDTYGFLLGDENDTEKVPVAIAGRVLAYPLHDKSYYEVGDAVCATEGGKIDKMTREEIKEYPDRIIGIVNEIPDYDIWEPSREGGGREPIHTNGRIWIDVR